MKKILALILTFATLCSLAAGCKQETQEKTPASTQIAATKDPSVQNSTTPDTQEPTLPAETDPTEPTPTEAPLVVRDAIVTFQENRITGEPYCIHIPEVVVSGSTLPFVSQQIAEDLQTRVDPRLLNMTYNWWHNDTVLSILVELNWSFDDATTYVVYNISPENDALLTPQEFCNAVSASLDDCQTQLTGFLQAYCDSYPKSDPMWEQVVADTMSYAVISESIPFLGPDGKICYFTHRAGMGASGWSAVIYTGDGNTFDPDEKQPHLSCSPDPIKPGVDVQNGQNVLVRDASVRFQTNEESIFPGTPNCFHIPEVVVGGSVLSNVSNSIASELQKEIDGWLLNMTYYWWYKGDVLSLLVELNWAYNDDTTYLVYNISLSKDTFLTQQEFFRHYLPKK